MQCGILDPLLYAWLDQYFPKLYMRLSLPHLGKQKDYALKMLAIDSIEARK